jgi:putative ABC transport system permease protein
MQGLAGATAGAALGGVAALGAGLARFGTGALATAPWTDIGLSLLSAISIGCLLSLLGVLYPAIVAARMQPVEAMRAEH